MKTLSKIRASEVMFKLAGYTLAFTAVFLIFRATFPEKKPHPPLSIFIPLFKGQNPFPELGIHFSPFKKWLPPDPRITFIGDQPSHQTSAVFFTAQAFFAPTTLTLSGDRAAVVYCSNSSIAQERMQKENYALVSILGDGKAVGVKKS